MARSPSPMPTRWGLKGSCRSGRTWLIVLAARNPDAPAVKREAEEDWAQGEVAMSAETAVIKHFQARMPYGLVVPDIDQAE